MTLAAPEMTRSGLHLLRQDAFGVISDDSAYWIGFMFADGCVEKDGKRISLRLSECDRGHLVRFRDFLGSTHPITECPAGNFGGYASKPSCRLSIGSKRLATRLLELGRYDGDIPAKLRNSRHFWRGVVDGDGSVGRRAGGFPDFQVVGSKRLMDAFLGFLTREGVAARMSVRPSKSIFTVATAGHTAAAIMRVLYDNAPLALNRKARKVMDILAEADARRTQAQEIKASKLETIREQYEAGYSLKKIGTQLGCSDVTVMRWMKEAEMPRRRRTGGRRRDRG